jgi:hypothetical protein
LRWVIEHLLQAEGTDRAILDVLAYYVANFATK